MTQKRIIAVISAYGAMTECDNRYRVVIQAENAEEFNAKLKAFMCGETVRAMTTPEISGEIGPVDPAKVYEALDGFTFPEEGKREVIEVAELSTDYHVENPSIPTHGEDDVDPSAWRNAIVMTAYDIECHGQSEFPSVVDVYDLASEIDEEGKPILISYSDNYHGTIYMTGSELSSHLLCWDRHVIPVM